MLQSSLQEQGSDEQRKDCWVGLQVQGNECLMNSECKETRCVSLRWIKRQIKLT